MIILYIWTRSKEKKWEWTIFTVYEQEQMIFTVHKWKQMIYAVHKWKQMILWCAHFQELIRNDWEMTKKEWEISLMTINDQYNPLSFAIHEQSVMRFLKTNFSC